MMSLLKFAFRNTLRNKKRTFLTALTIFFGALVVGAAQGYVNGILNTYIDNFVKYQTGHIRITTKEYQKRERFLPVDEYISEPSMLIEKIKKIEGVTEVRERIRFGILLGKEDTTVQAIGMGIDLLNNEFELSKKIKKGGIEKEGLFIGVDLAGRLNVKEGESLLIATKTSEGGLNGIRLPVKGIFHFGVKVFDKKIFFIDLKNAKRLLKLRSNTTEIYVFAGKIEEVGRIHSQINSIIGDELKGQDFKEQLGTMYDTFEAMKKIYIFVELIILFLTSFVIINTMMMAIFERIREIGTLKAMGMTNRELFYNFTLEGTIIGAYGGIIGSVMGYIIIVIIAYFGINLEDVIQGMDAPIEYIIRPRLEIHNLVIALLMCILVPALAAMIPARFTWKLTPSEALRK